MKVAIIIYLVSAVLVWWYVKISHSIGGRYRGIIPDSFDVWLTLLPLLNTIAALMGWIAFWPYEQKRKSLKLNAAKFFLIK